MNNFKLKDHWYYIERKEKPILLNKIGIFTIKHKALIKY